MGVNNLSYITGRSKGYELPLQNFLPQLPRGTFSFWVEKEEISSHLLIDPISANPMLAVELAANGNQVLSSRSNPILWLMSEVLASAPTETDFSSVKNKILNMRHGDSSISNHLQGIYETQCINCGKMIQPDGFVWARDEKWPLSKVYQCRYCGDEGEKEINDFDRENIVRLGNLGIHRSRAFQRVAVGSTYEHTSLSEALNCYLPRALYVCMLLINLKDRIPIDKKQSRIFQAILLSIFNDAHSLKHWPLKEYRFLQLTPPQKFFEKNLYISFQNISQQWKQIKHPIKTSYWPHLPPKEGGICFFQRELAEKKLLIPDGSEPSVVTIFPRPGQAFWTLSAIWAGWLWGNKAVGPMRSAFSRRRYDWFWFTKAVHKALSRISSSIPTTEKCLGLLPEYTPNLSFGLFAGMHTAGYKLKGAAYRLSDSALQCQWEKSKSPEKQLEPEFDFQNELRQYLAIRGEPAKYHHLIMHSIIEYARKDRLPNKISSISETAFSQFQNLIKQMLSDINFLIPHSTELSGGSRWWLIHQKNIGQPISERIENSIRNFLLSQNEIQKHTLDRIICSKFVGTLTPDIALFNTVLNSYTNLISENSEIHRLRQNETKISRDKDLKEMKDLIKKIGDSFHLSVTENEPMEWVDPESGKIQFVFYFTVTAEISKFIFTGSYADEVQKTIVFPGSRSALINFRLLHDPHLALAVEENWHFLKFRTLKILAMKENLDLNSWGDLIDTDPPLRTPPNQLPII